MTDELLAEFEQFFVEYKRSWNTGDAADLLDQYSRDAKARWTDTGSDVSDWDYNDVKRGTETAYREYEGQNPVWHFEDVLLEITNEGEGIAVFLVGFECDGEFVDQKKLFVEAFRREDGEWKKIREYVETGLPRATSV